MDQLQQQTEFFIPSAKSHFLTLARISDEEIHSKTDYCCWLFSYLKKSWVYQPERSGPWRVRGWWRLRKAIISLWKLGDKIEPESSFWWQEKHGLISGHSSLPQDFSFILLTCKPAAGFDNQTVRILRTVLVNQSINTWKTHGYRHGS